MGAFSIKIAERLKPFSHLPGTSCLLPKSFWQVQVFPALLRFKNPHQDQSLELMLQVAGPVKDFTVQQDLEKGLLLVFGKTPQGYLRYLIIQEEEGIVLYFQKLPVKQMVLNLQGQEVMIKERGKFLLPFSTQQAHLETPQERLSLGMHKAQDWALVHRRCDLQEIFPIWYRLAGWLPEDLNKKEHSAGMHILLKRCEEAISSAQKNEIVPSFENLFLAGFYSLMTPRLFDFEFQGIVPNTTEQAGGSALFLLKDAQTLIRSLFFHEKGDRTHLLPALPPEFHAGRFINICSIFKDQIDLEWSKKTLRCVIWRAGHDRTVYLDLQKSIRRFRLRRSHKERGVIVDRDEPLILKKGDTLYLDHFQK